MTTELLNLPKNLNADPVKGNLTETGSSILTITNGTDAVLGAGTTIEVAKATALADGFLDKDDFAAFAAFATSKRDVLDTQVASPVTGATVAVTAGKNALVLTPAGALAALTVTLPAGVNKQEFTIACTQEITALTMTPDGAETLNAPLTTIAAHGFAKFLYLAATTSWYRIG